MNDTKIISTEINGESDLSPTGASTTNFYEQKVVFYNQKQLDQALSAQKKDILKKVKDIVGEDVTIEDIAKFELPNIYTDIVSAKKELWEIAQHQNALRKEQRSKLSLLERKNEKI